VGAASDAGIDFAGGQRLAAVVEPPLAAELGFDPGIEDALARGVDDP
jgi:hypothetical protein